MPSMNNTRLRRSGIRKILRNFSSMLDNPLRAFSASRTLYHSILEHSRFLRAYRNLRMPSMRAITRVGWGPRPRRVSPRRLFAARVGKSKLNRCRSRRSTQNHSLAARFFDLLYRRLRELVGMNRLGRGQFARAENLDQCLLARGQAQLLVVVQGDLGYFKGLDAVEIDDRVLGAEDVGETALGQTAMQRHLAAFKTAHQAEAGTRTLTLVAAG